jgi:hypothetical protein
MTEPSAVTQRVGFTGARLRISRLRPDGGLERTLERLCELSAHALGVVRVGVWLAEMDQDRLRCVAQFAEGVERPALDTLSISGHPHSCAAVLNNRFVAATDVSADARTRELAAGSLAPLGITSMLDAALCRAWVCRWCTSSWGNTTAPSPSTRPPVMGRPSASAGRPTLRTPPDGSRFRYTRHPPWRSRTTTSSTSRS